jgi:hypothetical protein
LGGLAALGGGAYLGGRVQMQRQVDATEEQLAAAKREVETLGQRDADQRQKLNELEARRRIHQALIEFEQNNFGVAQEHLRAGAAWLEAAPKSPDLAPLAASLNALELAPSVDLAAQRASLNDLAKKFDALRPPPAVPP